VTPPPGPRGETLGRLNDRFWRADPFGFLRTLAEEYGDIAGFDLGQAHCILVNGAAEVRSLFVERHAFLRKPEWVKSSNRGHWGDGLTTLEGAAWRDRRQVLRASFQTWPATRRLALVAECTRDMLASWTPGKMLDLATELRILTARIAARQVLDADVEGHGREDGRLLLPLDEVSGEDLAGSPGGDASAPLVMVRPRAPRDMATVLALIDRRIADKEERGDLISALIRAGLPRDDIVGEVIQFLYSGHLTIPEALMNFWRDIAAAGMEDRLIGNAGELCRDGVPDPADIGRSWCLAALKESMRLRPPAPLLYREVEAPFALSGFSFAADTAVWVSPHLLHNDPRWFATPARFWPERFLPEGEAAYAGVPYFPFGVGPRRCIAMQHALQQMTLIVLLVARRLHMRPVAGTPRPPVAYQDRSRHFFPMIVYLQ
jgi:enediyne biosynthesis protein E7